jgi:putative oxidoreductase
MWRALFQTDLSIAPTILRIVLGVAMFPHGAQKLLGWFGGYGYAGTMQFFTQNMKIPAVFAALAILAEFFGSLGLIFGVGTRIAALGIGAVMVVAVLTSHLDHGFFMNWAGNQKGEGFEYHILAAGIALTLLIVGGGRFSIDRLFARGR